MAKKKKRGGGGGGGGGGVQQKPAAEVAATAEGEEHTIVAEEEEAAPAEEKNTKEKKTQEKKAEPAVLTAVLKVDMHCDGCAKRIRNSIRCFPGVEGVLLDVEKGTMTVVGRFEAKKLRDRVVAKTKKRVDLLGGGGKKEDGGGGGGGRKEGGGDGGSKNEGGGCGGNEKGNGSEGPPEKQQEHEEEEKSSGISGKGKGGKDKKPVLPVVAKVVLKIGSVGLHCDGCTHRIRRMLFKIKGVEQVAADMAKNQVTVTGTMDIKALPEKLSKKLHRPVDVVPPNTKKEGNDKEKEKEKAKGSGDGKEQLTEETKEQAEAAAKAAIFDEQVMYATQFLLSDENPNACFIM